MKVRHYCFLSYGVWGHNPAHIRPRELGAEMLRRGIRVSYVVDDYPENQGDFGPPPGAEVVRVKSPRSAGQLINRRRILRDLAPDYVHIKDLNWRTFEALARPSALHIVFDWDEPEIFKNYRLFRRLQNRWLASWMARRCDTMVVTTRRLQQYVQQKYGIVAVYLPYATYIPPQEDGISPFAEPAAVYMGSMNPTWDIDVMMDAIHLLAAEGFKPPCVFVGGGNSEIWRRYAADHGLNNVKFTGFLSDAEMWRYLRHAHVLLFPIRPTLLNETRCPSKTLVYAQSRRPVITSAVGEVAAMLGDHGLYVDPTPQAMAQALKKCMSSPRLPDIDYGIERYNYSDRVDQLLRLLEHSA